MDTLSAILVPTDFSAASRRATRLAVDIAQTVDARVIFVHTPLDPDLRIEELEGDVRERIERRARRRLSELVDEVDALGVRVEAEIISEGPASTSIVDAAERHDAGLIVLGARGERRKHDLGSVSRDVFRRSDRPVLTVPPPTGDAESDHPAPFRRILVPTDFSEASEFVLGAARSIARTFESTVLLLHVVEEFVPPAVYGLDVNPIRDLAREIEERARAEMDRIAASIAGDDVVVENHIAGGHAPLEIVDFAVEHDVDAILLASRGSRIERFLVGSVSDKVVRAAPCPVLTLKPDGKPLPE